MAPADASTPGPGDAGRQRPQVAADAGTRNGSVPRPAPADEARPQDENLDSPTTRLRAVTPRRPTGFGPTGADPAPPNDLFTPATDAAAPPSGARPGPDGGAPDPGYTVKASADTMAFHTPDSPGFAATTADVWFRSAADAEAAGFRPWSGADR